jgi:transcriptional regulator with XRE-family HTH domain
MKNYNLAEKIKEMRKERAWSQSQLSLISSLSLRTIQRVESEGKASFETLLAIASAFEIDVKELTSLYNIKKLFSNLSTLDGLQLNILGKNFLLNFLNPFKTVLISLILIFPPVYFIGSAILKYVFGDSMFFDLLLPLYANQNILTIFNIISPIVFLVGLSVAVLINLATICSCSISKKDGSIDTSFSFNVHLINFAIAGISILSLAMLVIYAIGENFVLR